MLRCLAAVLTFESLNAQSAEPAMYDGYTVKLCAITSINGYHVAAIFGHGKD